MSFAIAQTSTGCRASLATVAESPLASPAVKLCYVSPMPTTIRQMGVVLAATMSTGFWRTSGRLRPVALQSVPARMPSSTEAMATVYSRSTLKMMRIEIVGIAAGPRLACTIGTPSWTLLPKMPAIASTVVPAASVPKARP